MPSKGRRSRNTTTKVQPDGGAIATTLPIATVVDAPKSSKSKQRRQRRKVVRETLQSTLHAKLGRMTLRDGKGTRNAADLRATTDLVQCGNTPEGRAYAIKAAHPNGEGLEYVPKVSDGAATASVPLERRDEFNITKPSAITDETWDLIIVSLPTVRYGLVAIAAIPSALTDANVESAISYMTESTDSKMLAPSWLTLTFKDGTLYLSILQRSCLDMKFDAIGSANMFEETFREIRRTYAGLTVDYDASDLHNEGRVVAGQFNAKPALSTFYYNTTIDGDTRSTPVPVYDIALPPTNEADIVQQDLKVYQQPAKCGVYMPMRMWEDRIEFVPSTETRKARTDIEESFDEAEGKGIYNLVFHGWGIGVIKFMNIHATTSIRIKSKEGLELVPSRHSDFGPFSTPGAPDDLRAQQILREFGRTEPHAYPASYNEKNRLFGELLGGLTNAVANLGLPLISPAAGMIGNLLGGLF